MRLLEKYINAQPLRQGWRKAMTIPRKWFSKDEIEKEELIPNVKERALKPIEVLR